jgi:hypothetical protein
VIEFYHPEFDMGQDPAQETKIQKFLAFHRKHPEVFEAIRNEARVLYPAKYMSMRRIIKNLRATSLGLLKINNNYAPYYTDVLIELEPCYDGRFQRRGRALRTMKKVPA